MSYIVRRLSPVDLLREIDILAGLNTRAWSKDGWNEKWVESDDPREENPRTNSRALVRWWASLGADVFVAQSGGEYIGFAVGILFDSRCAERLEWWNQPGFSVQPAVGDYEMHAVWVLEEYRRNGLFPTLVDARWENAIKKLSPGSRIWVQALPGGRVERYYTGLGFDVVGSMHMKQAQRIFLCRKLTDADFACQPALAACS